MIPSAFSPAINKVYKYLKRSPASSFFVVSLISRTSTFTVLVPNWISMISPGFTFTDALAGFIIYQYTAGLSRFFSTVRRLINLVTFKNLSNLSICSPVILLRQPVFRR